MKGWRWRDYTTDAGRRPVKRYLSTLGHHDAAMVLAAMRDVAINGLDRARHLEGDIYEVRVSGDDIAIRVLFAAEGRHGQVLLALEAFTKRSRKTPRRHIVVAQPRLANWRARGISRT